MMEICGDMDHRYHKMTEEQDAVGWRHFMEGMLCQGLRNLQEMYKTLKGLNITGEQWATGVIIKLLEITHGQWLYCCVQIQDRVRGTQIMQQKEKLQMEIEA
jgi:hypothetical protein